MIVGIAVAGPSFATGGRTVVACAHHVLVLKNLISATLNENPEAMRRDDLAHAAQHTIKQQVTSKGVVASAKLDLMAAVTGASMC